MKYGLVIWAATTALLAGAATIVVAQAAGPSEAERAAESRQLTKSFAGKLKGELVGAMKAGGAESAIGVCQAAAPSIAEEKSDEKGWSVGRTALKLRNPANAPDEWEQAVLLEFQEKVEQGADIAKLEHYETTTKDGKPVFRYMKAIPTQQPCLTCHGSNVSESVQKAIAELYPQDKATGFSQGELRGAFTIVQPLQ